MSSRTAVLGLAAALAVAAAPAHTAPAGSSVAKGMSARGFGTVLATKTNQALYVWNREADRKIRCTGACVTAWPIHYVPAGVRVPRRIPGFSGVFGTIRRPENGRRQLTWNGRPLYTYAHEGPRQVLCNDVDDWFVVRANGRIF